MKRILFVDDETRILDGFRRSLRTERDRWEMEFVNSGDEALHVMEKESFDVVVSDMKMPGMDGSILLGHVRDRYPKAVRIILSGYTEAALATRVASVAHRFVAKPCDIGTLQSTIERVCALQDLVGSPEIRKIVGSVGQLPSLSATFIQLTKTLENPNSSIVRLAEVIEQDVAMSAKVLQLTNSAFFGLAHSVTNLSTAVSFLGMETIKNLALASEAFRVFVPDARIPQSVCDAIQRDAHYAAAIAGVLPLERKFRDIAVVAALLHDIGRLFLASTMPDTFRSVFAASSERKCRAFEVEEETLGTSHAEIGAYLLGLWGIPNLAVEAIAHHHHPERIPHPDFDVSTAVYAADLLAFELQIDPEGPAGRAISERDHECLETMGLLPRWQELHALAAKAVQSNQKTVAC